MSFQWPDTSRDGFTRETLRATHDLHSDSRFSDDGLADLLERYPREHLGVYAFPAHREGRIVADHGSAHGVSGRDLLDVVKRGKIWLNLRNAGGHLSDYGALRDDLFDGLDAATGKKTLKRDLGVLISSPGVHVHYHLDIPLVVLVQVRGEKRVWLYPTGSPYAEASHVEAIALREREEDLPFADGFDAGAEVIDLKPGMAITWPQTAPHRVQNGDMMNVSLSCEFQTMGSLIRANAIHANGVLRRKAGLSPGLPGDVGPATVFKAALSRGVKVLHRPPEKAPSEIRFRVDPMAETGVARV